MKNKKGFTLVELLAVIAILAIIAILIIPNVIKLYERGREEAFEVQIRKIIKAAETKNQSDFLEGGLSMGYCNIEGVCPKSAYLDNVQSDLRYMVSISEGKTMGVIVQNKDYCYINSSDSSIINKEDFIRGKEIEFLDINNDYLTLACGENTAIIPLRSIYAHWNAQTAGAGVHYNSVTMPSVTVPMNTLLTLNNPGVYSRTHLTESNEMNHHEICMYDYLVEKDVCIGSCLITSDIENTKRWFEERNIFTSCTNDENSVTCNLRGASCAVIKDDKGYCVDANNTKCSIDLNGEAWCD